MIARGVTEVSIIPDCAELEEHCGPLWLVIP